MEKSIVTTCFQKALHNGIIRGVKKFDKNQQSLSSIQKEISIHKMLTHKFIIKYVLSYQDDHHINLVLEYAQFNLRKLIIPTIGLNPQICHMIFVQITSAVKYLHQSGICHRDIKPDNILITSQGNAKLSDFGASTLFKGRSYRRLKSFVGTYKFMAPEVFVGNYDGPLADIFSLGISLLNMLTGKFPWENASHTDERYRAFKELKHHLYEPFSDVRGIALRLIEKMLKEENERIKLDEIEKEPWFTQTNTIMGDDLTCLDSSYLSSYIETDSDLNFTQPEQIKAKAKSLLTSQPLNPKNIPSLYRIYLKHKLEESLTYVRKILSSIGVLNNVERNVISFTTTDSKRNVLTGEVYFQELENATIVTFKKSKGDIIEFQKLLHFLKEKFK